MFSKQETQEIINTLKVQTYIFIAENISPNVLMDDEIELLKKNNIQVNTPKYTPVEEAFYFGVLSEMIGDKNSKKIDYKDFSDFLQHGGFIPLNENEKMALDYVKKNSYNYVKSLSDKITNTTTQILHSKDSKLRTGQDVLRTVMEQAIEKRRTAQEVVSELGHQLESWNKDLGRIAETELQTAYENGRALSIEKKSGLKTKVYKDVFPGACRHCISLYTTHGIGSEPKVFELEQLIQNGTNIGKKTNDWKPVVGAVHPFCRCQLHEVPEDFDWNEKTRSFDKPKPYQPKVQRKSKVKIIIGTKVLEV